MARKNPTDFEGTGPVLLCAWLDGSGTTVRGLAAQLGLSFGAVGHWMAGRRAPSLDVAVALERVTRRKVPVYAWVGVGGDGNREKTRADA